jgi:hypothetical protein
MPRKKIVREPVEKINEDMEQIAVIEDSDSEADIDAPPPPPPKLKRQNAKSTRAPPKAKVPCEFCGKEYSKSGIRLHQQKCGEKMGKKAEAPVAAPAPPPVENVIIEEAPPAPIKQDEDEVPKWFKKYLEQKEKSAPAPAPEPKKAPAKKRGRPAGVKNKPKAPPPPPAPSPPTPQAKHYAPPPQMMFV